MNRSIINLYQSLPYPLRSAAASTWGYYLRWLRYSGETETLAAEALERDHWSASQWRNWTEERLAYTLHRAATRVPFYRSYWSERRARGDRSSWERLENWPLLNKESVRQSPEAFVADDCNIRRMHVWFTSGSTGTPLRLYWSRRNIRRWYALFEARSRRWYGVSRHDRWAIVGGQRVAAIEQKESPVWVWNRGLNQLYVSAIHLSPALAHASIDAIRAHNLKYIVGYPSALQVLAQYAQQSGVTLPMSVAITNAEPLFDSQRDIISSAFCCPVRDTYGSAEVVAGAGECECGSMHLWPDTGIVEVFNRNHDPAPQGLPGELVCTGLVNDDMPLIRYCTRDSASLPDPRERCGCGRNLPLLGKVEGRLDDVLVARDGRRITRIDGIFKGQLPVREVQVIQEAIDRIRVVYAAEARLSPQCQRDLTKRFVDVFGETSLQFDWVPQISRLPNGKFRSATCLVPPEDWPPKKVSSHV
ncbi:MAG: phenylacetate--CoA ligase family protein [Bryobacterales bacterium]|nr:phenylacetate--CoA ligase family protein [Bryobacterales bacterium]